MIIYVVKSGDTVYSIAKKYSTTIQNIININGLTNPDKLAVGESLIIPVNYFLYTVKSGDTLYKIANEYGITINSILRLNPDITNPSLIYIGQNIKIPTIMNKLGNIDVNGYLYVNIEDSILNTALPYLTYISPFSYEVKPDGTLTPLPDNSIISKAISQNVQPLMIITNIDDTGRFNSELANTILTNEEIQNTLITNIISILNQKNYYGLDIDFEYVFPSDRQNYNNFLQKVVDELHPLGFTVTTAVAPKLSADQPGLLYEAHDYAAHGRIVDHIIIMTYEWGYTYGPPQAVAPSNQVEKVLQYAVSVIPSKKILMGMPNYGYNWTLPFVQGSSATSLSNVAAVDLAKNVGAEIQYNSTANAPFFYYYDNLGKQHVVWFDDARSINTRLKFIAKYNLGGVSYWTINRPFPQNWPILSSLYNINKL